MAKAKQVEQETAQTKEATQEPKKSASESVTFEGVVKDVANIQIGKEKYRVLTVSPTSHPNAGVLKVVGDAETGDAVAVAVKKL